METWKLVEQFSVAEIAALLGINRQSVYQWGPIVPELRARQLADLVPTLRFDASLYQRPRESETA